jgi:hypothetical protein
LQGYLLHKEISLTFAEVGIHRFHLHSLKVVYVSKVKVVKILAYQVFHCINIRFLAIELTRFFGEDSVPVRKAVDTVFFDSANHHSKELFIGRLLGWRESGFHSFFDLSNTKIVKHFVFANKKIK